jgi:importin-5
MSILAPQIHAELEQLLQGLQSADNNIRSQAEDHLQNNWTNTRPEVLLLGLAEQIGASTNAQVGYWQRK